MQALDLKHQGWKQRDIATALGVTKGAVSQWLAAERAGRREALLAHPRPGPRPKLAPGEDPPDPRLPLARPRGLWLPGRDSGPVTGSPTSSGRSSASGIAEVKSPASSSDWDGHPQVPITRAIQRDEEAIERWRVAVVAGAEGEGPPRAPGAGLRGRIGVLPPAGGREDLWPEGPDARWWASGRPATILSVMGGVTPQGKVYSLVRPTSLNGLHSIEFLLHLGRLAGDRLLVIWDGSPIHRRVGGAGVRGGGRRRDPPGGRCRPMPRT